MIIEDDEDVRLALADALTGAGVEVLLATDGQDGLEQLRAGCRPAVILLDLRMPRIDGDGFLRAVRGDPVLEHIPVITMTAGLDRPGSQVVAHLRKPFDLDDLLAVVLSLCDAR